VTSPTEGASHTDQPPNPSGALQTLRVVGSASVMLGITQLLSFGSTLIVSRTLGPDAYGRFGLALVFSIYAFSFIQWGLDPLLARKLTRASASDARRELGIFFRQRQLFAAITILAGIPIALFWQVSSERMLIYLGLADGVILAFTAAPAFDARGGLSAYFALGAVRQAINLALAGAIVLFAPAFETPFIFLALHAISIVPQLLLEWNWLRRNYGAPDWTHATSGAWALAREAAPMAVAAVALQVLCVTGPPALEFFGQREAIGALVVSNLIATALSSFASIPGRMVHVKLSEITDPYSPEFRKSLMIWSLGATGAGIIIALVLAAGSDVIVHLFFGAKFAAAGPLFAIDVFRIVGVLTSAVLGSALICRQRKTAFAVCHVLAMIVTIAIAGLGIPKYGASAAAASVVAGRGAFALFAGIVLCLAQDRKTST
jgi:O-antigen/teichoic acid export membrane protein